MAAASLAFLPRPLALPSPRSVRRIRPTKRCRLGVAVSATNEGLKDGVAIVWFKQDLRVDDHPGLVAAAQYTDCLPLYVFDHQLLRCFSDEMLKLLVSAIGSLKSSLQGQGLDLMIRFGRAEKILLELVDEVNATCVLTEDEVEYSLLNVLTIVDEALMALPFIEKRVVFRKWQAPLFEIHKPNESTTLYDAFKKLQKPLVPCQPCPRFHTSPINVDWGDAPSYDKLKEFMDGSPAKLAENWALMREISAETILRETSSRPITASSKVFPPIQTERICSASAFVARSRNVVGGGSSDVLNALTAYIRYNEGTSHDDWQGVHAEVRKARDRGSSFYALFGPSLMLGILSRRRVYSEAVRYEKEGAGSLSPFGYSVATIAAATDAVCSIEWYYYLARISQQPGQQTYSIRIWRWRGHLIQYTVVGDTGPSTLLVHGFGAFLEHYRDNIQGISDGNNRVWALTLLGFGRSEKPNIAYTELLWAELLRDFVIEVVGEPVHLVGNSIGGYVIAILAGLWPKLLKSVVLINSGGDVIPGYSFIPLPGERLTSGATWLGARVLLFYLKTSFGKLVKDCYPAKPERADEWLLGEMLRASNDPGGLAVLESIFSLNLSLPLNYLLKGLEEKVLVIQGMRDPISNSRTKLSLLRQHCPGISIHEVDAGHCPHDELPEEVNSVICKWIKRVEENLRV
ncbi:hypothetical protein MLD38_033582 [Melastoma candidum]|uniref:Uncharacterized protein n=1 Tax=Melastoma candidum TaxID=119954 RepID=A0ACB9M7P8_9MYRT|nr:hypothetical protein MLD38_033582 [Melastoma candidum]